MIAVINITLTRRTFKMKLIIYKHNLVFHIPCDIFLIGEKSILMLKFTQRRQDII